MKSKGPRILFLDIETAPMLNYNWGIWDQNVSLDMVKTDWHLLSWAAKWQGNKKMIYADQRGKKHLENDKMILKDIWKLIDEADILVTQNGKSFDIKKLNARFAFHGIKPPSPYKHIDTLRIAKKYFAFTSNKLDYMSKHLGQKHKKMSKRRFSGFSLWKECLANNKKAWAELKKYNIQDVLTLEELYDKLKVWDNSVNLAVYYPEIVEGCIKCGHSKMKKEGFFFSNVGKYQRFTCPKCGYHTRSRINLLGVAKRKLLKV